MIFNLKIIALFTTQFISSSCLLLYKSNRISIYLAYLPKGTKDLSGKESAPKNKTYGGEKDIYNYREILLQKILVFLQF